MKHVPVGIIGVVQVTEGAVETPEREGEAALEAEDKVGQLQKQLQDAMRQKSESERIAADYLNRLQRLQADMENIQKITKRQLETVTSQASERLLLKLLPSLDALRQAVKIANSNDSLPRDEIAVGLKMLQEQLSEVLETEGLHEIPAEGESLDPELHEVVSYVETDEKPENTVLEEIRKGYKLNGKVIRPSLVVVSKKPRRPEQTEAEGG
jgi:molecular chaperone GrpE